MKKEIYVEIRGSVDISPADDRLGLLIKSNENDLENFAASVRNQVNFHGIHGASTLKTLEDAYLYMLQTPSNSLRIENQSAFCQIRDAIAIGWNESSEFVQDEFECRATEKMLKNE